MPDSLPPCGGVVSASSQPHLRPRRWCVLAGVTDRLGFLLCGLAVRLPQRKCCCTAGISGHHSLLSSSLKTSPPGSITRVPQIVRDPWPSADHKQQQHETGTMRFSVSATPPHSGDGGTEGKREREIFVSSSAGRYVDSDVAAAWCVHVRCPTTASPLRA